MARRSLWSVLMMAWLSAANQGNLSDAVAYSPITSAEGEQAAALDVPVVDDSSSDAMITLNPKLSG